MNRGSEPTFVTRRSRTIIDLTLATETAANHVSNWHVSQEASCSDHRWIRFDLQVSLANDTPHRNPRKTDQPLYRAGLVDRLGSSGIPDKLAGSQHIEQHVKVLTNSIMDSYHSACPLTFPATGGPKGQNWWGPELERLRKKVRRLLNRAMNTCEEEDWDRYKEAKSKFKKRIRYRKTASWRNFCNNIETGTQANRLRKVLSCQSN